MRRLGRAPAILAGAIIALSLEGCGTLKDWWSQQLEFPTAPVATIEGQSISSNDKIGSALQTFTRDGVVAACALPAVAAGAPPPPPSVAQFVMCRRIQVDELCTAYFDGLEKAATVANWSNRQFDILGDTTSTIMGLSNVSAQQLAILAGSKLALDSSFNNAEQALMLAPAPYKVRELVKTKQISLMSGVSPTNLADAIDRMREYAYQCTVPGIHELVDDAISSKTMATGGSASGLTLVVDALNAFAGGGTISANSVTSDDVAILYRLFVSNSGTDWETAAIRSKAQSKLSAAVWAKIASPIAAAPPKPAAFNALHDALVSAAALDPTVKTAGDNELQ